jgi:hypothetical protein
MKKLTAYLIPLLFFPLAIMAQDTLPNFSVRNIGENRIVLGWVNNFENVRQINIQRSFDSLKNFKTILSVADPSSPENGYVDNKANNDRMFYRIYIQLDKGVYFFSDSKRPVWDTSSLVAARLQKQQNTKSFQMPNFVDSVNSAPSVGNDTRPKPVRWIPSPHIFTNSNGYIKVALPDADIKKYSIKVFTLEDELLFELKDMPRQRFQLDKSNFGSSGWFNFELYEEGKLKEKNKFFLPKEF